MTVCAAVLWDGAAQTHHNSLHPRLHLACWKCLPLLPPVLHNARTDPQKLSCSTTSAQLDQPLPPCNCPRCSPSMFANDYTVCPPVTRSPALATIMSTPPSSFAVDATMPLTSSPSLTSHRVPGRCHDYVMQDDSMVQCKMTVGLRLPGVKVTGHSHGRQKEIKSSHGWRNQPPETF